MLKMYIKKINIKKVFLIFTVGFISRMFINYCYNINVFEDYTNIISLIYYTLFSCFIVYIKELMFYLSNL
jgi:hypothetical protein